MKFDTVAFNPLNYSLPLGMANSSRSRHSSTLSTSAPISGTSAGMSDRNNTHIICGCDLKDQNILKSMHAHPAIRTRKDWPRLRHCLNSLDGIIDCCDKTRRSIGRTLEIPAASLSIFHQRQVVKRDANGTHNFSARICSQGMPGDKSFDRRSNSSIRSGLSNDRIPSTSGSDSSSSETNSTRSPSGSLSAASRISRESVCI